MATNSPHNKYERWFGLIVGTLILAFVMTLIWLNKPFASPDLARMARIVLALGAGAVGATIPGFLRIDYKSGALAIRAAGGLAVFLVVYFGSPTVQALHIGDGHLTLRPVRWIEFRAVATPESLDKLNLDAPGSMILDLRATNDADQLGRPVVITPTTMTLIVDGVAPENFSAKYFVKIITGGTLYGGTPEDKLGLQSDVSDIALRAGDATEQSILHVSDKVGLPGYTSRWRDILGYANDGKLSSVDVSLEAGLAGRWMLHCPIDRGKSAYLVKSMLNERGVFPRYFHADCEGGEARWQRKLDG